MTISAASLYHMNQGELIAAAKELEAQGDTGTARVARRIHFYNAEAASLLSAFRSAGYTVRGVFDGECFEKVTKPADLTACDEQYLRVTSPEGVKGSVMLLWQATPVDGFDKGQARGDNTPDWSESCDPVVGPWIAAAE